MYLFLKALNCAGYLQNDCGIAIILSIIVLEPTILAGLGLGWFVFPSSSGDIWKHQRLLLHIQQSKDLR